MSLRKIALILGISPTYLSLLLNGKRPWRGNLKKRYLELVYTFVDIPETNTAKYLMHSSSMCVVDRRLPAELYRRSL